MSDVPPPPPGFTVVGGTDTPPPPRRQRSAVSDAPPPPPGFSVVADDHPDALPIIGKPTGAVHDGDTFALDSGRNARLYGADAFELNQTGRTRQGDVVPLGQQARVALTGFARPDATVTPTGALTYNRPVASLELGGKDAATAILQGGYGIATPEYLKADPARLGTYMEAERDARLNRRGAWAGSFEQPSSFRHGTPDPWAKPVAGKEGESEAVFWDDPLPAQGLRPEIAKGWIELHRNPTSTADDIKAYAKANGFDVDAKDVDRFIRDRAADPSRPISDELSLAKIPRVLTDHKDGVTGAALRGVADPFNVLDETGAVVDSLLPGDRENLWSSDRRFGDVYANNLDQNRSILAFDDAKHPYARFGGQLVGGLIAPGASIEGVGFGAARGVLEAGGTRFAAEQAAKRAVVTRLGVTGGVEGAAAGVGQGEDWKERIQGGLIGAPLGVALGAGTGLLAPHVAKLVGRPFSGMAGAEAERSAQDLTDGALDAAKAGTQNRATPASVGLAGDAADVARLGDDIPPPPAGFSALDDAHPEAALIINRAAPTPSPVTRPRDPVTANTQAMDETGSLGPKSILSFVPPKGEPGVSVINQDGQLAVAVYRDGDGVARGAAQVPLTPEARETFDGASVYVAPELRRQGVASRLYDALEQEGHPIGAQSGSGDLTPDGAGFVSAWRSRDPVQAMENETAHPSIDGPAFSDDIPAPPAGFAALDDAHPDASRIMARTPAQVAAAGETVLPADILPVPSSAVGSIEEAERIAAGRVSPVRAPNEADVLERRNIPSPRDGAKTIPKRGPLDMVTWLRTQGGIRAQGGELEHYGIDNAARKGVDFAGGENRFGPLVSNEGMTYDDAAHRAWEAGFFPDHVERPTVSEFLDTLNATHSGNNRAFRSQDLPEVDAYEAARSQRHEVEAAQQEGTPLVQDRGEPVGLDDLDANAPPVHAYEEWGDNAPTMAGNIRLDKLDSPQSIARAIANTHSKVGGFDDATRGRITHAETESLASELGMTAEDLLKRRKGQALNAEEALAARQILSRSATDLVNLAKRFHAADNPGDEMERKFSEAWMRHVAIQEQVAGATAEAGRALSAFRMAADSRAVNVRVLGALEAMPGGSSRLRDMAGAIVDMERVGGGPGEIAKFTAKALKPRFRDKIVELWYNSLLSGPQTHAVNIMGNTMTALGQVPEHMIAAGVGAVRNALPNAVRKLVPNRAEDERVLFSEAGARIVGLLQGTKEGLAEAARTFRTGEAADAVTKVEQQSQNAIPGKLGSVIRTPTRALAAEDELFKAMARRMELAGLSVRQAGQEGLKGPAAKQRAADLLANPTDDMLEKSFDYGRYLTFQRPLEFGSFSQGISNATNNFTPAKLIIPFVRTPVNILKFAAERSPVAPFVKTWRADVAAGGARRDLAIAKLAVGSGVMALSMQMAADGHVTGGGPADPAAKSLLQADGWQPYSVKIGDKYYSYSRLDPFSTTLGVAADFAELQSHMTEKQRSNVAMLLAVSTAKNLTNKVWFSGVSDLSDAINDPERYGANFVQRLGGSLVVPGGVAQLARTVDPTMRETETLLDAIRARVPGLSKSLEPKRDTWGQPIVREGGLGPDFLSPIATSTARKDPLNSLLLASDIHISKPSRVVGGERMPAALYGKYREQVGILARPPLQALGQSKDWQTMEHDDKQAAVTKVLTSSKKQARELLGIKKPATRAALGGSMPVQPAALNGIPPPPPGYRSVP